MGATNNRRSDHVAPLLGSQRHVPSRRRAPDLTDLFAFPKPGDAGKSILIMNFHPSVGIDPPGPTTAEPFAPAGAVRAAGSTPTAMPSPTSPIRCASRLPRTGARRRRCAASKARSRSGRVTVGASSPRGCRSRRAGRRGSREAGDHRVFVGRRSDPFFFDVVGVLNDFKFTGRRLLRRQGHLQRRPGSAQLGSGARRRSACGSARWSRRTARAGAGCRRTAARGPHKRPS